MRSGRLEAFSDGVLAIVITITIMVLEMKVPHAADWAALRELWPVFLSYILSFVYVGIYWNNHHHLLAAVEEVNGAIMWTNLHLLFWITLIPFVTGWMGENHFAPLPTMVYGCVLLLSAVAYLILQRRILAAEPAEHPLRRQMGRDWKGKLSPLAYLAGIVAAAFLPMLAVGVYALVAVVWIIPDRRVERALHQAEQQEKWRASRPFDCNQQLRRACVLSFRRPRRVYGARPGGGDAAAMSIRGSVRAALALGIVLAGAAGQVSLAQELEPRRWSHLPTGADFTGGAFAYTGADISDAPALQLTDVHANLSTYVVSHVHSFALFDKSARIDVLQPYQQGSWTGKLAGAPAQVDRAGFDDTIARFSVNLYGAPALSGEEFAAYRAATREETIVGAGLLMQIPTGEYDHEKLINIGSNRFTFRPQLGVVHSWGNWSAEMTGEVWIYTDNPEFFGENRLGYAPFYTVQTHLIYTFRPGLWTGLSFGAGMGQRSTLNDVEKDDRKKGIAFAASFGVPVSREFGGKIAYVGRRHLAETGTDADTVIFALSLYW